MKALMLLALFVSMAFAWDYPTCELNVPFGANNFSLIRGSVPCATASTHMVNWNVSGNGNAAGSPGGTPCMIPTEGGVNVSDSNITIKACVRSDGGTAVGSYTHISIRLPSSGNYTYTWNDAAGNTIIDYNSTHFNISGTFYPKGGTWTLETGGALTSPGGACASVGCVTSVIPRFNYSEGTASLNQMGTYGSYGGNPAKSLGNGTGSNVISTLALNNYNNNNYTSHIKALLYYGDRLLTPSISYVVGQSVRAYSYNSSAPPLAYLRNNTLTYVYDESTLAWYVVPPYSASTFADTLTLGTFIYQEGYDTTPLLDIPQIPILLSCAQDSDSFDINAIWSESGDHKVYYWSNTSAGVYSLTNSTLTYSVDTTVYPYVNYTFNGVQKCGTSGQTLLGLQLPEFGDAMKPFIGVVFLSSLAIGAVIPPALLFPVMLNDALSIVSSIEMAILIVLAGLLSGFINHKGELTLKSLSVYLVFGMAVLMYYFGQAGMTGTAYYTGIQTSFNNFQTIVNSNSNEGAFYLFAVVATAAQFLIQLGVFLITMPLQFGNIVIGSVEVPGLIYMVSPQLGAAMNMLFLGIAFTVGATAFILLKLYEVIADRQIRV